jgi:hypothetical protein
MRNQKSIPFKSWNLTVWLGEQPADALIAVRPIAEAIGVAWQVQHRKLTGSDLFTCHHMVTHDTIGRNQDMLCLSLGDIALWLATISPMKVKPEVRNNLIQFQRDCQITLSDAIRGEFSVAAKDAMARMQQTIDEISREKEALRQENAMLRERLDNCVTQQEFDELAAAVKPFLNMQASMAGTNLYHQRHTKTFRSSNVIDLDAHRQTAAQC